MNQQTNTPVVDLASPLNFTWQVDVPQEAYLITIYDYQQNLIWTSGWYKEECTINQSFSELPLALETIYTWDVKVRTHSGKIVQSNQKKFITAADFSKATFITADKESAMLKFTYSFEVEPTKEVSFATAYVSALGAYRLLVNGKNAFQSNAGEEAILNPGWTDYHYQLNYQAVDITAEISHSNELQLLVGKGWFAGRISQNSDYESLFKNGHKQLSVIAKVVIHFTDGEQKVISTTPQQWRVATSRKFIENDIYDGERVDYQYPAFEMLNNAIAADLDQSSVRQRLNPENGTQVWLLKSNANKPQKVVSYDRQVVINDERYPLGKVETNELVSPHKWEVNNHKQLLFDFGQNMAATVQVVFHSLTNQNNEIVLKTGEILNDGLGNIADGTGSDGPRYTLHRRNLNSEVNGPERSSEQLIVNDQETHTFLARFTFHGFRYIEASSKYPVIIDSINQVPLSSTPDRTSSLTTNNQKLNRLIENIQYGTQSNYLSIPTDSPNRSERAGWTADTQVFSKSGLMAFDSTAFLTAYLKNINSATPDNLYRSIIPQSFNSKLANIIAAGWSDIGIILPWRLYQQTGDIAYLKNNFEAMHNFMKKIGPLDSLKMEYNQNLFGDWLSYAPASTQYIDLIYRAYTAQIMIQVSDLLQRPKLGQQYRQLNQLIKKHIQQKYIRRSASGEFILLTQTADQVDRSFHGYRFVDNSQTGLLWFLKLHFYRSNEERDAAVKSLEKVIDNKGQKINPDLPEKSLAVGFLGINVLLPVLTDFGLADQAYDLLLSNQNPSWLLAVDNGATTVWERWDSYTKEKGISPTTMNSYNHYAYGSIMEWLYQYVLGVKSDPSKHQIIVSPHIDRGDLYNGEERIHTVQGAVNTVFGKVKINWHSSHKRLKKLVITVPENVKSKLILPKEDQEALGLSKGEIDLLPGENDFAAN